MKNNNDIKPIITYTNLSKDKSLIYKNNLYKSGIYRWNNIKTNKSYVSLSINLGSRLSVYFSIKAMLAKTKISKSIIYSVLLKHGYTNFTLDILEYCNADILIEREQCYFDLLKPEYNICKIAGKTLRKKYSESTKKKIGKSIRGKKHPFFGKHHIIETRINISKDN